jgi:hypothetical protein
MTPEDLETAIARTGVERYGWLTSDANPDAAEREAFRRRMVEIAAAPDWPPPEPTTEQAAHDFAALRNATKLGSKNCWFSDRGCGCDGLQCHLLKRRINIYDCVKCLARW